MTTVLVTGANGFLGRHTSRVCARHGHRVIGIGHGYWTEEEAHFWGVSIWHELDVTLAGLLAHAERPDLIIHCAGSGSVGFSFDNPAQDFERTVETTLEVLEYIRTCAPDARLIYPSSAAVYGRAARTPIPVNSPLSPISPYGVHKQIAEDLCRSYGRSFGLHVAVVRIFSAYGSELRKQLLWDACRKATRGEYGFAGSGRETRDWVHAEDVANLLLLAGAHTSPDVPVVNGATGDGASNAEVLAVLFAALGVDRVPEFSGSQRSGDPEVYVGDATEARVWGWSPRHDWRCGVREYASWFKESAS
jgi:UDP-glucose 4-epimerase